MFKTVFSVAWVFVKWLFGPVDEVIYCDCEDCVEASWWRAIK